MNPKTDSNKLNFKQNTMAKDCVLQKFNLYRDIYHHKIAIPRCNINTGDKQFKT